MRPPTLPTPRRVWIPFVVALIWISPPPSAVADIIWINEFHYDNAGSDIEEFLEVVVLNSTFAPPDLGTIRVDLYDSSGQSYDHILLDDTSLQVTSTLEADFYVWNPTSISDGTGGISLTVGPNTTNFISYGGVVTATDGAADGSSSTDVGFTENNSTLVNQSIGLTGAGFTSTDFFWDAPMANTSGGWNVGQSFGEAVPEPTSTWIILAVGMTVCLRRNRANP